MGWPVDLECAFKDGKLYLLQCRPVTTLAQDGRDWSVEWDDPKDAKLTWRKGNLEVPLDQSFERNARFSRSFCRWLWPIIR